MGFNLTVMDNDGEDKTKQWLEITGGIPISKEPSLFRDLIFMR